MNNTNWRPAKNRYFTEVDGSLIPFINEMIIELEENKLQTELVNAEYGDNFRKVRVAVSKNPKWYSDICAKYQDGRPQNTNKKKKRTIIKRKGILQTLYCMVNNGFHISKYGDDLLEVAIGLKKLTDTYEEFEPFNNQF